MRRVDDVADGVLELSCFAYTGARPPPPTAPGPSRPTGVVKKDPPDRLADSQLAQLSKCICCELQWTSKKSTKQKRTHIEQCAKKHGLTKHTIRILIEKEIASLSPTQNAAPANDTIEMATATLMDSVVPAGPAKKFKRQQVVPTVRSLPETRESILDRARDILGPTRGQADPQPTQQFGQSALARRNAHPKRPALLDVNRSMEEPPPTQPFGVSSLRGGTTERPVDGCEEHPSPPTQQFGGSMFDQESALSSVRLTSCSHHKYKRPASPPTPGSNSKHVRPRLLQ